MNTYKKLTTVTLICNLLVIVGHGHGVAPLDLYGYLAFWNLHQFNFSISFSNNYENTLFVAAVFSMLGQLCLIISNINEKRIPKLIGILLLWTGFIHLVHSLKLSINYSLGGVTIIFCLPFLILSIVLFVFVVKTYFSQPLEEEEI